MTHISTIEKQQQTTHLCLSTWRLSVLSGNIPPGVAHMLYLFNNSLYL